MQNSSGILKYHIIDIKLHLATCILVWKYTASALKPAKLNSTEGEKFETKVVGNGLSDRMTKGPYSLRYLRTLCLRLVLRRCAPVFSIDILFYLISMNTSAARVLILKAGISCRNTSLNIGFSSISVNW